MQAPWSTTGILTVAQSVSIPTLIAAPDAEKRMAFDKRLISTWRRPAAIGARDGRRPGAGDLDAAPGGEGLDDFERRSDLVVDVDGLQIDGHSSGLEARQVPHVVDDRQDVGRGGRGALRGPSTRGLARRRATSLDDAELPLDGLRYGRGGLVLLLVAHLVPVGGELDEEPLPFQV